MKFLHVKEHSCYSKMLVQGARWMLFSNFGFKYSAGRIKNVLAEIICCRTSIVSKEKYKKLVLILQEAAHEVFKVRT